MRIVGRTDQGKVRSNNEDFFAIDDGVGLAVLADGMGGLNAGEVASERAVTCVVDAFRQGVSERPDLDADGRELALQALARIARSDERTDRARLVRSAFDGSPAVRVSAIRFLSRSKAETPELPAILGKALNASAPVEVRRAALAAIEASYVVSRPPTLEEVTHHELPYELPAGFESLIPVLRRVGLEDPQRVHGADPTGEGILRLIRAPGPAGASAHPACGRRRGR